MNSPTGRPLNGPLSNSARDTNDNGVAVLKLQYQRNLNDRSYLRLFGYSVYSNWFIHGDATQNFTCCFGAELNDYEIPSHTYGTTLTYSNQVTDKHLLTFTATESQTKIQRRYNYSFPGSQGLGTPFTNLIDPATAAKTGNCFDPGTGAYTSCFSGAGARDVRRPRRRGSPRAPSPAAPTRSGSPPRTARKGGSTTSRRSSPRPRSTTTVAHPQAQPDPGRALRELHQPAGRHQRQPLRRQRPQPRFLDQSLRQRVLLQAGCGRRDQRLGRDADRRRVRHAGQLRGAGQRLHPGRLRAQPDPPHLGQRDSSRGWPSPTPSTPTRWCAARSASTRARSTPRGCSTTTTTTATSCRSTPRSTSWASASTRRSTTCAPTPRTTTTSRWSSICAAPTPRSS